MQIVCCFCQSYICMRSLLTIRSIQYIFHQCACLEEVGPPQLLWFTGHHEFNSWSLRQLTARTKSEENKSFKPNQIALSIYIMIELYFISLDQWEKKIHLLRGKCFNIPHWLRSHSTNGRLQHIEELSKSKTRVGIGDPQPNLMDYCPWQLMVSLQKEKD